MSEVTTENTTASSTSTDCEIFSQKPKMTYLNKIVIPKIMNEWEYIAYALHYNIPIVKAMKARYHEYPKKCCRELFDDWLSTSHGAVPKVWSTLIGALKQVDLISSDITEDIIAKIKQLDGGYVPQVTSETATASSTSTDCEIFSQRPEMFDLTKIVIPKIMNEWEYIAKALCYDLAVIETIKVKESRDPKKCCRGFFKDWLMTNNGAKAGRKVWSTLINALKQVDEIATEITEDIIAVVEQLDGGYVPQGHPVKLQKSSTEHQQSLAEHQQPSDEHQQPSDEHQQLSAEHQQPSDEHQQPSGEHQQPSDEHQQLSDEHQQPSDEHQRLSAEHQQPSAEHQQPSGECKPSPVVDSKNSENGQDFKNINPVENTWTTWAMNKWDTWKWIFILVVAIFIGYWLQQ